MDTEGEGKGRKRRRKGMLEEMRVGEVNGREG